MRMNYVVSVLLLMLLMSGLAPAAAQTPTPTPAPYTELCELVVNCDFEAGLANWNDRIRGGNWSVIGGAFRGGSSAMLSGGNFTSRFAPANLVPSQKYIISAYALFTHAGTGLSIDIVGGDPNNTAVASCPIVNPGDSSRWVRCVQVFTAPEAPYVVIGSDPWQGPVYVDEISVVPYGPLACSGPQAVAIPAWPDYQQITLEAGTRFYPYNSAIFYHPQVPPPGPDSGLAVQVWPNGEITTGLGTYIFYGNVSSGTLIICGDEPTPYPTPPGSNCPTFTDHNIPAWPAYVDLGYTQFTTAYPLSGELYYATTASAPPAPGAANAQPIAGAFGFSGSGTGRFYADGAAGTLRLCNASPTATATTTTTTTTTRTPSPTATRTPTSSATPTSTRTATPTFTPRPTVTAGGSSCREYAIADGETREIADLWTTTTTGPSPIQQFYVSSPAGFIMFGDLVIPRTGGGTIPLEFGGVFVSSSVWRFAYTFSATNNGDHSILRVCLPTAQLPTATATTTATTTVTASVTPTATTTATTTATATATGAPFPSVPTVSAVPIITSVPLPTSMPSGQLPDLSITLPTLVPLECPTATIVIPGTAVIAVIQTAQASVQTPAAAVQTASASYSWEGGQARAASWTVVMGPALTWLAIINPANTGWGIVGGPLWALAPLLLPVLPIAGVGLIMVFIRFFLWLFAWFLKLLDQVFKLIELIPGE